MTMTDFDRAYTRVTNVFKNEVSTFRLADLNRMGMIQDRPCCTIPENLAVFSFLDLLGFLMSPRFDDESKVDWIKALQYQEAGRDLSESEKNTIDRVQMEAGRTG